MNKKAVIVIDLTKAFASKEGSVFHREARDIVQNVRKVVKRARSNDIPVLWTVDFHRKGKPDWELKWVRKHGIEGTADVEFREDLRPEENEIVLKKRRYSAFFGTDLDLILRDYGVEELVIVGTKTNVCVRATAQDAFARNYRVLVPRECTSTDDETIQKVNLDDIDNYMGEVIDLEEALEGLTGE